MSLIDTINEQFNKELRQQIENRLPIEHIYQLGYPSEVLLNSGFPNLPIEIAASIVKKKADVKSGHPFFLEELHNLPKFFASPFLVFDSKTRDDSMTILTEIQSNGYNFLGAVQLYAHPKGFRRNIIINDIRSIYPKDNVQDIINWISSNRPALLKYTNKEKTLKWLTQQQSNFAGVDKSLKGLYYATKVIQNFENPKFSTKNYRISNIVLTDEQQANLYGGSPIYLKNVLNEDGKPCEIKLLYDKEKKKVNIYQLRQHEKIQPKKTKGKNI